MLKKTFSQWYRSQPKRLMKIYLQIYKINRYFPAFLDIKPIKIDVVHREKSCAEERKTFYKQRSAAVKINKNKKKLCFFLKQNNRK